MTVLDSGVLVDVHLGRIGVEQLGAGAFDAPHLVDAEFLHVLRRHNRMGLIDDEQAVRIIMRFGKLAIERHPTTQAVRERVWDLRPNLTAYDATYVALAEVLDTTLLTTDARIARAPGIRCPIEVL